MGREVKTIQKCAWDQLHRLLATEASSLFSCPFDERMATFPTTLTSGTIKTDTEADIRMEPLTMKSDSPQKHFVLAILYIFTSKRHSMVSNQQTHILCNSTEP